jgi:preprotein translocase subunit SecF
MKLPIIQKRKIYFIFSGILIIISLLSLIAWGLRLGIDFTGGSLMEVQFKERPTAKQIQESLQDFDLGEVGIQPAGDNRMIIRFKDVDEELHHNIIMKLKDEFGGKENKENKETSSPADGLKLETGDDAGGNELNEVAEAEENNEPGITVLDKQGNPIEGISFSGTTESGEVISIGEVAAETEDVIELRFDSIGPSIGQELRGKSIKTIIYVVIAIIIYIAWAFRKVSKPVTSWKYGIIAVIALLHDVLITVGVFVFLGHYLGVEINTPFIAALLTILGYSVNDSIVVFDRVRENLHRYHENFEETVNDSVNETLTRSLNTSITTIFVLLAVFFFGGETIKSFVLALIIGMSAGTYSSIFIASPLLVTWHKISEKLG